MGQDQTEDLWHAINGGQFHELANRYGTPFFLYDANDVINRIVRVRDLLQGLVKVFYAVKANPNLELLHAVRSTADGLDISSGGELEQAVLADYDMATVSFAGPAKTAEELSASIRRGIGCISIESMRELNQTLAIAQQMGTAANVVARVNPQKLVRAFGLKMGGLPVQFGLDEERIGEALELIRGNSSHLKFQGIHIYAGSQCFEASGIVESVANTLRIARSIENDWGLPCKKINFGGGFGISHGGATKELDIDALAVELVPVLREFHQISKSRSDLIFELGRFITANAGIYVARVISSKESRGKTYFVLDGGLHHHLAAAGTFGSALRANYPLKNLSRQNVERVRCDVAGPSCNPTDLLAVNVDLARPEYGDLIGVLKSGSYGLTASPMLFLGRQTPAELVLHNGKITLGRRPRVMTDFN
jgi:diaminopimelate decarboxylase